MKLQLKIEDGAPMLFFLDCVNNDKTIDCFTLRDGHSTASRAYMRSLKSPETAQEKNAAWGLLKYYADLDPF